MTIGKNATKSLIQENEKRYMLEVFRESPHKFVNYAQGDLMNYEALQGHSKLFAKLYKLLGLEEYYIPPKPTIAASVHCLLEAALLSYFKINNTNLLRRQIKHASHNTLIENFSSTQIYLAKINGGRCFNNRPTEPSLSEVLVDIDINGCYGKGLKLQDYPVGRPVIIDYKIDSCINEYDTLEKFLKRYEEELVDGLWFCRISTFQDLSFDQDFFISWFPPDNVYDILQTDTDKLEIEELDEVLEGDHTRIYSRQIHLAPLQSDGLEWIRYSLNKGEREECMSKCYVIAAAFYPKSFRCNSLENYKEKCSLKPGRNSCKAHIT
uniref:DNA-directed DNA polymerase n=1 Tax=Alsidium seaforthii TaxID=2007182 RepID=A0A1Z1MCR7_9FLOR|nr:hypothetical protein [Bryothamnion seaforthii]ARW63878.1 hypothetical protein [Bryothamnion seaforthii]